MCKVSKATFYSVTAAFSACRELFALVKNTDFFDQRRAKEAGGVQPVAKLADNDQISPENVPPVVELWS